MDKRLNAFVERRLPSALEELREWVGVNTHTRNQAGVEAHAAQVETAFAKLGFTAERPDAGIDGCARHLFLKRAGTGPVSIAMISHLDTVFPADEEQANDFRWKVDGDRIYGPGTWDIKGGTLMALLVLEAMEQIAPEVFQSVTWHIAANSSEEILNHSFGEECLKRFPDDIRAALVFEGDGLAGNSGQCGLIRQRKGRAIYRIRTTGQGAHAGAEHETGVNAIRQLARLVESLEQVTSYEKGLTLNIGRISGGVDFNRVPHEAEAIFEMRAPDQPTLKEGMQQVERIIRETTPLMSGDGKTQAGLELTCFQQDPAWQVNPGTDKLINIWKSAAKSLGVEVIPGARGGLSDGNFIWHAIPALDGLGPAGGNAHQSEHCDSGKRPEYILPDSFKPKIQVNFHALLHLINAQSG